MDFFIYNFHLNPRPYVKKILFIRKGEGPPPLPHLIVSCTNVNIIYLKLGLTVVLRVMRNVISSRFEFSKGEGKVHIISNLSLC